jgi:hypothetical protein
MTNRLLDNKISVIIVSAIFGLGLASIFRQVCKGRSCIIINGPSTKEINEYFYKIGSDCYKYIPYVVDCDISENNK